LPEDYFAWTRIGQELGDTDPSTAIGKVELELRQSQQRWELWEYLAVMYAQSGRLRETTDIFLHLVRTVPTEPRYRFYLGLLFAGAGDPISAADQWKSGLEMAPRGLLRSRIQDLLHSPA
jgi:cytochrome c-type biogenesis protein CcmH/NrfG